jgi:hypothetical protein
MPVGGWVGVDGRVCVCVEARLHYRGALVGVDHMCVVTSKKPVLKKSCGLLFDFFIAFFVVSLHEELKNTIKIFSIDKTGAF